ncbi:MAG TPA: hypothetical protein VNT26_01600, partial [Candidatus Sulfotelmatobacter sp.]|nr:hypothetical protein [Candidatus Sulfotelmatobacter sp.]
MPHLGYVYPAGGRQGTTFQVVLGGQSLLSATNAFVSGSGVQTKVIEYTRPLTQKEFNELRDKLRELQEKRVAVSRGSRRRSGQAGSTNQVWTAADDRMVEEIRKKLATFVPRTQINPAIAETTILQVTMAADAEPGQRELRLETQQGLSNPLRFYVGRLPEFTKRAATANRDLQSLKTKFRRDAEGAVPATEMNITLPAVVNGQTMPGGVDRYHFKARAGQRLTVAVSARDLIPYLPDAVPGWFQASISLYGPKGQELQYADHFRFNPDPVLFYEIPQEGEYTIEIRDSIYRGREDFVYRMTVGELPCVTSLFPLGAPAGTQTAVELKGWNLPSPQLTLQEQAPGIHFLAVSNTGLASWPFAVDILPERLEQEPNDHPTNAQPVTLPLIINGRIEKPGDRDVFRFEGRAGSELVAEVFARRLNSPLDSVLRLTDAAGHQLAYNDD